MIALNSVIVVNVELLSFNHYSPINKNKSKKKNDDIFGQSSTFVCF